ncbi:MAG: DUF58 domain-containing protein [Streptosporangiaceae bacterium]|nr:DUF58 domain-containing protein [Streptosporangiaceae bacterium]MBV9857667.1 DUF58 domain-containing protein [Streptosporangiaceae bacterium]
MRALFGALTTRGRSFVAAGVAAAACGLLIPEPDLLRVGALLIVLPLLSALAASRARYRLSCTRRILPARVPTDHPAQLTVRLANVSRLRTGLLLAEDALPYSLGSRPRFVLDGIEAGGSRELSYQIRSDTRGRFTIGPLQVRVADTFGLVEIGRSFSSVSTLTVTPRIIPLARPSLAGSWLGDGDRGKRTIAASGEDDVAPRAYRDGDGLRRVHWRSTARYGELMVRREEQHWRNTASLFLDTRRGAHTGTGPSSSFELAVSAAASIGMHLTGEGFDARLVTDAGEIPRQDTFQDMLLDTLAVIGTSRGTSIRDGVAALAVGSGQIVAILGTLSAEQARQLAAARRGGAPAMALLLAAGASRPDRSRAIAGDRADRADGAVDILASAGWRVATVNSAASLIAAWDRLNRPASDGETGVLHPGGPDDDRVAAAGQAQG